MVAHCRFVRAGTVADTLYDRARSSAHIHFGDQTTFWTADVRHTSENESKVMFLFTEPQTNFSSWRVEACPTDFVRKQRFASCNVIVYCIISMLGQTNRRASATNEFGHRRICHLLLKIACSDDEICTVSSITILYYIDDHRSSGVGEPGLC
jgi:hypothetical protein